MAYLFSGKVKCMKCLKNFRGKMNRKHKVYVCSGWSNRSTPCTYYPIEEERLIRLVKNHIGGDDIPNSVQKIEVDVPNITIHYIDGSKSIIKPNSIIF